MLDRKLKILHLIALMSMFIDVTSLKCFQCDSREQQNCTAKLPHSALVECNYEYFANIGLEHLVGRSSFVCITAHATKVGQADMVFKSCAPDNEKPCQVVMPEVDDGTNWKCKICKKDACNTGNNALMAFSLPLSLFFSLALLIA